MSLTFQFVLLGLASGGLYALSALSLIVVHRVSGAINFANGAIAITAAYALSYLRTSGVAVVPSIALSLVLGAVLGILIQLLVMRPLRRASTLTKAIATLCVLVVLQAACQLKFGTQPLIVPAYLPQHRVSFLGATITVDVLITVAIALVLAGVLSAVYRRTRFGLATSAVSENDEALAALGWSTDLIALGNWAIAGFLSAVTGVLLAPSVGVSLAGMTTLLLPALAAALFGGLRSFTLTFVSALGIGVLTAELTLYSQRPVLRDFPNLPDAIPFLIIMVVLMVRGRNLPTRDFVEARLPALGAGRIRPRVLVPVLVGSVLLIQWVLPVEWVQAVTTSLIAGVILCSLVLLIGYAGQLSLAQLSIGGVGALVATRLVADGSVPFPLAALIGVLAAVPLGLIVGLPAARARGATLAVVTLGLAVTLNAIVFSTTRFTGGNSGIDVGLPSVFGWSIDETLHPRRFALVVFALFAMLSLALCLIRRSRWGRRMIAVRGNERAAASVGVSVVSTKLTAFAVSAAMATVGAILGSFRYPTALFTNFDPFQSVNYVVQAIVGGVGFVTGAAAGSTLEPSGIGSHLLDQVSLGRMLTLVGGILALVTVVANPDGLAGGWRRKRRPVAQEAAEEAGRHAVTENGGDVVALVPDGARDEPASLVVDGLTVTFGTVVAVNEVGFDLRGGEVLGIIGPNGAGKTTLIDALTGYVPAAGTVLLDGEPVHDLEPHRRSRLGILRSFQSLELFEDLSVRENLLVGMGHGTAKARQRGGELSAFALTAVEELGLAGSLDQMPSDLSYGKRRLLAIARALASRPSVLLLDEPAAGLDDRDRQALKALIRRVATKWQIAVILIEHDVELVMAASTKVLALNFGTAIAFGKPDDVRRHPEVISSYLGIDPEIAPELEPETEGVS